MRYCKLLVIIFFSCLTACTTQKIVYSDVSLGNEGLIIPIESPSKIKSRALRLCVEPISDYSRELGEGVYDYYFVSQHGEKISVVGTLLAFNGENVNWPISTFYLQTNLACFSIHRDFQSKYKALEINSSREIHLNKVFWEWAFYL